MAITPSQWSHVLTIPESYTPSGSLTGYVGVITEAVIAKLSAGDQTTFWSNVLNGGGDVRICTDSAGTNQLPIEVLSLDNVAETCVIWYRNPTYTGTGDLYVFIGKSGETQPPVTDTFGRNAVYSNRYAWMKGDGADSGGRLDLNPNSTIQTGTSFSTNNSYQSAAFSAGNPAEFTAYFDINAASTGQPDDCGLIGVVSSSGNGFDIAKQDSRGSLDINANGLIEVRWFGEWITIADNTRKRVHIRFTGSTAQLFVNGSLVRNDTSVGSTMWQNATELRLGASAVTGTTAVVDATYYSAYFDESALSDEYIATEYANQSDPASFYGTPTIQATSGGATTAGVAYTVTAPTFSADASVTLPQPSADTAWSIASPQFSANGSATLPQPVADLSFSISAPTFSSTASATLPQPASDVAFTITKPSFAATASATIPGFNASVSFSITEPQFSATADVTLPQPSADVAYAIGKPTFSVSADATLPQPSSTVSFTLDAPQFSATASATLPGYNANVAFEVTKPEFSSTASVTLPSPSADVGFTVTAPTFSVVAIVGGIAIIVDNESNINMPALSNNIDVPALSNNINL